MISRRTTIESREIDRGDLIGISMRKDLVTTYLEKIHREYQALNEGEVASYIPELFKADPDWFGIALVTVDGHVYQVGETQQPFTIQSISKVVTHGIGLEDFGTEAILKKVDVEPSGEAFNSISLEQETGRPKNPMINAGAIATTAFIKGQTQEEKLQRLFQVYNLFLGRNVKIDEEVYVSERDTGHRNRAIAHMLRNYDIIESDTDGLLDLYFKQCSILVTARDLALIAASLANGGVNPVTGVRAIKSQYVPKMLSVMSSCGMYDYSGAWVYEVGMPAKSGVAGGIMAVLPGQLGIGVFSPKLDDRGNSVRGIAVCKRISKDFGLHMFHLGRTTASSVINSTYDGSVVTSKLSRNKHQATLLKEVGKKINVTEVQGDLIFASAEIVVSQIMSNASQAEFLIVDFRRIASYHEGAMSLLAYLVEELSSQSKTLLFTNVKDVHRLSQIIRKQAPHANLDQLLSHHDLDAALEWCENQLLSEYFNTENIQLTLADQALCEGFNDEELEYFESVLKRQNFAKGEAICRSGEPADELYFILSGQVSVLVPIGYRKGSRITSLSAGSAFGEMGLLDHGVRSADVVADTELECLVLRYEIMENDKSPMGRNISLKLISNIGRILTYKLRQATDEIKHLKS